MSSSYSYCSYSVFESFEVSLNELLETTSESVKVTRVIGDKLITDEVKRYFAV